MTGARVRLIVAAVLFAGWLGWLGYAVSQKGRAPVLSRAQLTAATHLMVADVSADEGVPAPTVKVVQVIGGEEPKAGSSVEVLGLRSAKPPGPGDFPGPGTYLIPVVFDGKTFAVAGMPRSPGYEATKVERPQIYLWNDDTRSQLRDLKLLP